MRHRSVRSLEHHALGSVSRGDAHSPRDRSWEVVEPRSKQGLCVSEHRHLPSSALKLAADGVLILRQCGSQPAL